MIELIRELLDVQLNLLRANLSAAKPDPVVIVEQAETLYFYAKAMRDFPELPESLRSQYPEPPTSFQPLFAEEASAAIEEN